MNERLEASDFASFRSSAPGAEMLLSGAINSPDGDLRLTEWLGLPAPDPSRGRVFEERWPPHHFRKALDERVASYGSFVHLLVGPECDWAAPVEDNPAFEGLDLSACQQPQGCSFCGMPHPSGYRTARSPVDLAMEQIHAAEASLPAWLRHREYLVRGVNLFDRVDELMAAVVRAGVPPSIFHFSIRIDRFVRGAQRVRAALAAAADAGHRLGIWNMGVENFSPAENERFNKGLDLATLEAGVTLARELADAWGETFVFDPTGGFGFILFTPWTTTSDLRRNIHAFRSFGLRPDGLFLGTGLQLMPGRAITALAERDGLLVEGDGDQPRRAGSVVSSQDQLLPYRFRDPRLAPLSRVLRSAVEPSCGPGDEPLFRTVQGWLDAIPGGRERLIDIFEAMVDAVDAAEQPPTPAELLRAAETALGLDTGLSWARLSGALERDPRKDPRFRSAEVVMEGGHHSVLVILGTDAGPVEILLARREEEGRYLLHSERVGLWHRGEWKGMRPEDQETLRRLLVVAEAVLGSDLAT